MAKVNFAEARERAEKEGVLGGGDYLKLQEGDNPASSRLGAGLPCFGIEVPKCEFIQQRGLVATSAAKVLGG